MKPKTHILPTFACAFCLLMGLWACTDEGGTYSADAAAPAIALNADEFWSEPGRTFHIVATVTDDIGLTTVRLQIAEWALDKTITLQRDSLTTTYALDYAFKLPSDLALTQNYTIVITATDVAGKSSSVQMVVNPNGDFDAPALDAAMSDTITVIRKPTTVFKLNFTVNDNKALDYVVVQCDALSIYDSATVTSNTYPYSNTIPLVSVDAVYDFRIAAVDKQGNVMQSLFAVQVSGMPDFKTIYLTDYLTKETLSPHLIGTAAAKRTAAYTYTVDYYAKTGSAGVLLIPQKTDLQPICFGIDPGAAAGTLSDDPTVSQPITFVDEGYYHITFNTFAGTYSTEKYTPTTPTPASYAVAFLAEFGSPMVLGIIGNGFPEYDQDWSPNNAIPLETDNNNPYILYKELDLEGEVQIQVAPKDGFHDHDNGWWMGWPDSPNYPGYKVHKDGNADASEGGTDKLTVPSRAKYRIEIDTHLKRALILKVQ